jgi:hypothetical protein
MRSVHLVVFLLLNIEPLLPDKRIAPTLNRVPDPEDIIGSVMVENGKTLPDSYQAMPSYRVVSGESGPMALSEAIQSELTRLQKE